MSAKIPWQEPQNRAILFTFFGFAALIEFLIVLYATYYFPINNIYVNIFVSLGVILFLTGIEILFAQIIHSLRIYLWQKKATKKKVGLKKVSMNWSIFLGAGISLGLFVSLYFIFSYYLLDPFVLIILPIYGKFALIEILSGIVAVIIIAVIDSALPKT
jgi:hypothetical protein